MKQDINAILTRLDNRIENPMMDGEKLDDEFRKEIEIITQNAEVLYI